MVPKGEDSNWGKYLLEKEIYRRACDIYKMHKGGYSQIQQLISYIDLCSFLTKANLVDIAENPIYLEILE